MAKLDFVIGNATVSMEFRKPDGTLMTDAEARNVALLFIQDWASPMPEGLTPAQQQRWLMEQFLARDKVEITTVVLKNHRKNKQAQRDEEDRLDEETLRF